MSNPVIVKSRKFLCQYRNGDDFSLLPLDFVPRFQANVLEKIKLIAEFDVQTILLATELAPITVEFLGGEYVFTHPFLDWGSSGFVVGNDVRVDANGDPDGQIVEVTAIEANIMRTFTLVDIISALAIEDGEPRSDFQFRVVTPPTALIFRFGLIPNEALFDTFDSILDGQEQVYSVNTVSASPAFTDLNYLASNSSNLGSVRYTYDGASGLGNSIFSFTVEHIFRVPHFVEEWLINYQSDTLPDVFAGINSFRYLSQLNFCNNILDSDEGKLFTDNFQKGSVGFVNQNFNAGTANYEKVFIDYSTGSTPEITETNIVTAQIKRTDGVFSAGVKLILYHTKLAQAFEYQLNANTYDENFVLDQEATTEGAAPSNAVIIKTFSATINADPTLLDIQFSLIYALSIQSDFHDGDTIALMISVEDNALVADVSDRVQVLLDETIVTKSSDIDNLLFVPQIDFTTPNSAYITTDFPTSINQIVYGTFSFTMTKAVGDIGGFLTALKGDVVAFDIANNQFFSLDTFSFPIISAISPMFGTFYQIVNLDTTRVLPLPDTSRARELTLIMETPPEVTASQQPISGTFGFIIPHQEWIENLDVPMEFYDGPLPDEFFNRNQRSSNYSDTLGYDIYLFLTASIEFEGVNTNYIMHSDASRIADFDEDTAATGWTQISTKYFNAANEEILDLDGSGLFRVEIIMANPAAGAIPSQGLLAKITTEPQNTLGRHWNLHSIQDWTVESGNPLSGLFDTALVTITQDIPGNEITLECMCDGTLLNSALKHNFYGFLDE